MSKLHFSLIGYLLAIIIHIAIFIIPFDVTLTPLQLGEKKIELVFEKSKPESKPKLVDFKPKPNFKPKPKSEIIPKPKIIKKNIPPQLKTHLHLSPSLQTTPDLSTKSNSDTPIIEEPSYEKSYIKLQDEEPKFEDNLPQIQQAHQASLDITEILKEYQMRIINKIDQNKSYPEAARSQSLEGKVHIKFIINYDGLVKSVEIIKSSGSQILDNEAIAIIKRCSPFPPIPPELNLLQLNLRLPIVFKLE